MRLIDADALEKEGWSLNRTIRVDMNTEEYQSKPLKQIPTIETERTGRWIVSEPQGVWTNIYHCSECGGGVMSCKVDLPKFCGHCGAKMEVDT